MATHEKELTRAAQNIEIYKAMASGISTERLTTPEESSSLTQPTASRPNEKEEAVSKVVFAKPKIR